MTFKIPCRQLQPAHRRYTHRPRAGTGGRTLRKRTAKAMLIRLTRLTNERHRFEIVRDDGTRESHELETRSTLLHDLAHYAVETEAGLGDSFYGRLAQGVAYADLTAVPPTTPEVMQTEVVVALMQNAFKDGRSPGTDAEQCARDIAAAFRSTGGEPPAWLTPDFIARARACLRRVQGQWRATPFHETMELGFSLGRNEAR